MFNIFSILLISLFLLTSCGFKALYKDPPSNFSLNSIEIDPIKSLEGAELYLHLSELLPLTQKPLYILKIYYTYFSSPIAVQKNADIIRENISQIINFNLTDISAKKVVTSGKFKQMTSYNSIFSPYGSHIEKEHAAINLTKYAAEEIRRRLIIYFKSQGV